MSGETPARPKLGDHVLARRHLVDGAASTVLHDTRTGRLVQLGAREWQLLAAADGTRDLEGIRLAARREGANADLESVRAFFADLAAAALLTDASPPAEPAPAALARAVAPAPETPLERLPGYSLHCDGSGTCCRIYASVLFLPVEVARARALLPHVLDAGERQDRAFLPERGAGPCGASAVALDDGRCAYLGPDLRCGIHAAGGAASKPFGCRTFPTRFVDDGETVRVSVSVECACVLRSIGRPGGEPLVASTARVRADIPEAIHVERVAATFDVAPGVRGRSSELAAWSRALAEAAPPRDAVGACLALARAVTARGLDVAPSLEALGADNSWEPTDLLAAVAALQGRAARRGREDTAWRSERDIARQAIAWIAGATAALGDGVPASLTTPGSDADAAREAFYLRATLFGHVLVGELDVASALRDRATRLFVARAMAARIASPSADDPAFDEPIALVEAMLRGHGLGAYVYDLPET